MKRVLYLVLALSLGLNAGLLYGTFSGPESAAGPERPGRERRGERNPDEIIQRRVQHLTRSLDLDATQQRAMTAALKEVIPQVFAEMQTLRARHHDLAAEFAKAELDPERIRALVGELTRIQAKIDALAADGMIKEASLLTPDQRVRFAEALPWRFSPRRPPKGDKR